MGLEDKFDFNNNFSEILDVAYIANKHNYNLIVDGDKKGFTLEYNKNFKYTFRHLLDFINICKEILSYKKNDCKKLDFENSVERIKDLSKLLNQHNYNLVVDGDRKELFFNYNEAISRYKPRHLFDYIKARSILSNYEKNNKSN